ncbi:hypothetical protein LJB85_02705 [Porphyromonadaceae bacterium OttesenSCG-928-L07]|nr:hypothetical protein [Porphyromonadaceae bacterium OttesenSCG-928-L07]MDL2251933.1 hypothetical protein [Odoribacter sp. OttesenSCG-928-J03]
MKKMMNQPRILFFTLLFALFFLSCNEKEPDWQQEHLEAFAKVYGLVRWFHPSDEAQKVNWEKFAAYGVSQIAGCKTPEQFAGKLEELFRPIAPGITFSDKLQYQDIALITPPDTTGMSLVSWQHYGVDLGVWSHACLSKRTNRSTPNRNKPALNRSISAASLPVGNLVVSTKIKKHSVSDDFKIFFKATKTSPMIDSYIELYASDTSLKPIENSGDWQTYSHTLRIDECDKNNFIRVAVYVEGDGSFSIEDIKLNGQWVEDRQLSSDWQTTELYNYSFSPTECHVATKKKLFDKQSAFGDVVPRQLMDNFYVHVPLALYGTKEQTWPNGDKENLARLQEKVHKTQFSDKELMLADIVVAWNPIKYFSPYLADLEVDWEQQLTTTLRAALTHEGYNSRPLSVMMAQLKDAHVAIATPDGPLYENWRCMPVWVDKINNEIVITRSFDPQLQVGDIILSINGKSALAAFNYLEDGISGGAHYKKHLAARKMWPYSFSGKWETSKKAKVRIVRKAKKIRVNVELIPHREYIRHNIPVLN